MHEPSRGLRQLPMGGYGQRQPGRQTVSPPDRTVLGARQVRCSRAGRQTRPTSGHRTCPRPSRVSKAFPRKPYIKQRTSLASADAPDARYTKPWLELGRQDCAWRSVSLGHTSVAGQKAAPTRLSPRGGKPLGKPTALGAHMTGTQRDGAPPIQGQYVLVCHRLAAVNSRSAR